MDGRTFLLFILSIAWIFLCQRWYCCWMQVACSACSDEPINQLAIGFLPGDSKPDTTKAFSDLVQELISEKPDFAYLEISGRYYKDENNAAALGIDRARKTRDLLKQYLPLDSMLLRSQKITSTNKNQVEFQELVDLQWLPLPKKKALIPPKKLVLHFNSRNTNYTLSLAEKSAIQQLIDFANAKDKTIAIDGHSDKSGNEKSNIKFSLQRALFVKDMVMKLGAGAENIIVNSYGSARPMEDVEEELNRRVEVYVGNG